MIAEITRRLDGLPLAIELAAARLHTLELTEVAAGLDDRFELLSAGYRSSSRHGSLGAAIDWSFGLLDAPLQRFFADISVFSGPFAVADAAAVGAIEPGPAASFLQQLAERSLVLRAADRRYVLLETLRAFGAERLVEDGRDDEVGRRHAHHQLDWIELAERRLGEPDSGVIVEIDAAITELRTALTWLIDHGDVVRAGRIVAGVDVLRLPAVAARRAGVVGTSGDGRPGRSQPAGSGGVGRGELRDVDERRHRDQHVGPPARTAVERAVADPTSPRSSP